MNIEHISIEMNLRKRKWVVIGIYKSPNINKVAFINQLTSCLGNISCKYENIILMGDFTMTPENQNMQQLLQTFSLDNLIKEPTCFKSENPTCIDLILTNQNQYLIHSHT